MPLMCLVERGVAVWVVQLRSRMLFVCGGSAHSSSSFALFCQVSRRSWCVCYSMCARVPACVFLGVFSVVLIALLTVAVGDAGVGNKIKRGQQEKESYNCKWKQWKR